VIARSAGLGRALQATRERPPDRVVSARGDDPFCQKALARAANQPRRSAPAQSGRLGGAQRVEIQLAAGDPAVNVAVWRPPPREADAPSMWRFQLTAALSCSNPLPEPDAEDHVTKRRTRGRPSVKRHANPMAVLVALASSVGAAAASPVVRSTVPQLRMTTRAPGLAGTPSTSSNWAGYATTPTSGGSSATSFSNVFGTWVQPSANCASGSPSYAAFWVGLGGLASNSRALEQIGTSADCSTSNTPVHYAWYELVPAAPVKLKLAIRPGDTISGAVTVSGQQVSLRLRNLTTRTVVNKKLRMVAPDLSSAEWIAEAPSTCTSSGNCRPLPLANFGTVPFLNATATSAGHSGTIADTAWSSTAIELQGGNGPTPGRFGSAAPSAGATPTALSSQGSFAVNWQPAPQTANTG
jgi:hypothetical protein